MRTRAGYRGRGEVVGRNEGERGGEG